MYWVLIDKVTVELWNKLTLLSFNQHKSLVVRLDSSYGIPSHKVRGYELVVDLTDLALNLLRLEVVYREVQIEIALNVKA